LDYEHAELRILTAANAAIWMPDLLRGSSLPTATRRVARFYAGLKENLYLDEWVVDPAAERNRLGVTSGEYLVVSRPPADNAHYASGHGGRLWLDLMKRIGDRPRTRILVASRTRAQRERLAAALGPRPRVEFLEAVVSGPALIAAADLVVGGGGTMNREAAVLGVPAWSVFTGQPAYIDESLVQEGRLRWVRTEAELADVLAGPMPERRARRGPFPDGLLTILADIEARLGQAKGG
jgi:predicted glycosyltransferase